MTDSKTVNEILAIAEFLGDEMSDAQAERLIEKCLTLSIADREYVLAAANGGKLYTDLSMHNREMGRLYNY